MRATHGVSLRSAVSIASALAVTACNTLLDVDLPSRVTVEALNDPALAGVLVDGVIADFECAYANYVAATALMTDEWWSSATGMINNWDRRILAPDAAWTVSDCTAGIDDSRIYPLGVYTPLAIARFQADDVYRRIEEWTDDQVPDRSNLLAQAAAYGGYAYVLFGEGFCEATFDGGPILQPDQVLELARARFDTAIKWAQQAKNDTLLVMAHAGRARVWLDLKHTTEAAADARHVVPESFVKNATYSVASLRRYNFVYQMNRVERVTSVDSDFRHLQVDGVPDPRVRADSAGVLGADGRTPLWYQTKYKSESSPIPIASWDEAQLIIAEAERGQSAVDRINALRAQASLPSFNSTNENAIRNQVLEERKRELYLEGHRLNDTRRWPVPFKTGNNHKGQRIGEATCIPLPEIERR